MLGTDHDEANVEIHNGDRQAQEVEMPKPKFVLEDRKTKFKSDIASLLIIKPWDRLACHHLKTDDEDKVATVTEKFELMIAYLHFHSLIPFMQSIGYERVGFENFDGHHNRIACETLTWEKENVTHTCLMSGWQYFVHTTGDRPNVIARSMHNGENGWMEFSTTKHRTSQQLRRQHCEYTRAHNLLRNAKLRNVNVANGSFEYAEFGEQHTWENYYYPAPVRESFSIYVENFLRKNAAYNRRGIKKRGVLYKGPPGTGKTSLGKVACNMLRDFAVIWITSDVIAENSKNIHPIKKLYKFADYLSPCAVFLEDLDLFGEDRNERAEVLALGTMMNVLDGVNSMDNVVTIATTNRPELVEKALISRPGRFDAVIDVPLLDEDLRRRMFGDHMAGFEVSSGVIDLLVKRSDGWSGATVKEFMNILASMFIESNVKEGDEKVTMEMAQKAISHFTASTPAAGAGAKGAAGFAAETK